MRFKHRVYTLGVPVGTKAYALKRKLMLKAGADVGLAINYKWKTFINDTKTKNHEFFSDRVARFCPPCFSEQGSNQSASPATIISIISSIPPIWLMPTQMRAFLPWELD